MAENYSRAVAKHYAAYRPPLHAVILDRVFANGETFSVGIDVGCGTGRSSVALTKYCDRVFAIDPSEAMLESAVVSPVIVYRCGQAESTPLPDHSVDVATFAGSLVYADLNAAAREVERVCRAKSLIIVYDFDVRMDDVMERLDINHGEEETAYDHTRNFSQTPDFDGTPRWSELSVKSERVDLSIDPGEIAHVLLANAHRLSQLVRRYKSESPYSRLTEDLQAMEVSSLQADIYYSVYRLAESA